MNTTIRTSFICLAVACISIAATSKTQKRLTAQRIAELTAPADALHAQTYHISISRLGNATLPAAKPEGLIESIREFRFPTAFDAPQANSQGASVATPTTPTAFETIHTGWTVRVTAKPQGKLVAVYGVADYIEAQMVPGGYGAIAGPIYAQDGKILTPNKLDQPRIQTTTTRFHIFAIPGEPYEVTFYHGNKAEKHMVTVTAE